MRESDEEETPPSELRRLLELLGELPADPLLGRILPAGERKRLAAELAELDRAVPPR